MKILKKISIFFIIFLILVSNGNITSSVQAENLKINNLVTASSINNKSIEMAIEKANRLPDNIKFKLYDKNFTIYFRNDLIKLNADKTTLAQGLMDPKNKLISVVHYELPEGLKTNDILLTESDSIVLLHEIGHAWDEHIFSSDDRFIKAFMKEGRKLFNTDVFKDEPDSYLKYYRTYNDEYFAECFALYFNSAESNKILKTHAPLTYNYIRSIIRE